MLGSDNFHWLLGNSLKVSVSVAAIVVPLAYLFAYALQRTLIPGKPLWRGLSLLPLMAPSMLPGIALVYLFGNQGLLRGWLAENIYGFWGIVVGEVIYTFPHALMILLSALSLADARLFDAASSMGASPWKAYRSITWPATRQAVFAALCLVFTLTITDFGVPVVVGGDYQVLALEAYKAVVGQQQFGRGALIGMILLLPALFSFAVDAWLRRRQGEAMTGPIAGCLLPGDCPAGLRRVAVGVWHGGVFVAGEILAIQPVVVLEPLPLRRDGGRRLAGLSQ